MPRHLPKAGAGAFARLSEPYTRRGLPLTVPVDLAAAVPGGAAYLLCRLPTLPLACFVAPLPRRGRIDPQPPSQWEGGEIIVFLCKGLRPLHPQDWAGRGTGYACGKPVFSALSRALAPAGAAGIWAVKNRHPAGCLLGKVCTCRKRFSAGVPGASPPAK